MKHSLSFDDVLILPRCSNVPSRQEICIKPRNLKYGIKALGQLLRARARGPYKPGHERREGLRLDLEMPYVSSPMTTVTGRSLAIKMSELGALPIIPRRQSVEDQLTTLKCLKGVCFVATGLDIKRIDKLIEAGVPAILVDVAFGANIKTIEAIQYIKANAQEGTFVMAGNTAVVEDAACLFRAGIDALRVGIGGGAACTTRIVTGVGVPTLQSVINAYEARDEVFGKGCSKGPNTPLIIADGGIRNPGDANKAILAGADYVMMGSQLAGTMESPGKVVSLNGMMYKPYAGMASAVANPSSTFIEGDSGLIPVSGTVKDVLLKYSAGLRSAMSYIGCSSMSELRDYIVNTKLEHRFTQVTFASLKESNTRLEK